MRGPKRPIRLAIDDEEGGFKMLQSKWGRFAKKMLHSKWLPLPLSAVKGLPLPLRLGASTGGGGGLEW